ncbi:MAG: hypothetical protein ACHQ03_07810 [Candidatus Bathyarchaeia archaeon]
MSSITPESQAPVAAPATQPFKKQQGRKLYFDCNPDGLRQVLDRKVPFVGISKLNPQTGEWESFGYAALAKSGRTVRIMVIQKETE